MADEDKLNEAKDKLKAKLGAGFTFDDEKMGELAKALEDNDYDIEKIDIDYYKKPEQNESNDNPQSNDGALNVGDTPKPVVINDGNVTENDQNQQNTGENNTNPNWKEEYKTAWRQWAQDNGLEFAEIPNAENEVSFRLFESEKDKKDSKYAAEIKYKSPHNVSLKGPEGNTPDSKYFNQVVAHAIKDGGSIEFGNIESNEFKAKLLAACYLNGATVTNAPSQEEIDKWPENLRNLVNDAKSKTEQQSDNQQNQTSENELSETAKRIKELKAKIARRKENLANAEQAAAAAGKTLSADERKKIEQEGMSAEEIKLRELRGQRTKDETAQHELDKRRYNTMTDEYKYVREVEMEADGKTPKKDKDGKNVYKKDKDGNFIYKTNEKGQKIETDAYKHFLARFEKNSSNNK